MAQRKPSFFGWLFKWVIFPFALAAIGFYLIGPRIGDQLVRKYDELNPAPTQVDPEPEGPFQGEPKVKIESEPASRRTSRRTSSRGSSRSTRREEPSNRVTAEPVQDSTSEPAVNPEPDTVPSSEPPATDPGAGDGDATGDGNRK